MLAVRIALVVAGVTVVLWTLDTMVRTFVIPRGLSVPASRLVFVSTRRLFDAISRLGRARTHAARDRVLVYWAPLTVLLLPAVWLLLALLGYALIFMGAEEMSARHALIISGSSLFTLGFAFPGDLGGSLVSFSEAAIGIGLLAVVITYLPAINGGFSRRELVVATLDARAGTPPTPAALILRYHQYAGLDRLDGYWGEWERWVVDIGETHLTHAMLPFFRSQDPEHSWVTALAALIDTANIRVAAIEHPGGGNAEAFMFLTAATGVLRRLAAFFQVPLDLDAGRPLSIERAELDAVLDRLDDVNVPLTGDRDVIWERFARRRALYDLPLLGLAALVDAPPAPWSSDRMPPRVPPPVFRRGR
jgi:hypothetical protein